MKQTARRLKNEIKVLGVVYQDPRTPWYAKAVIFLVVAYSLSPIDLIPDFIPVLGYLDDLILVPLGVALAIKLVPPEIFTESREKVAAMPEEIGITGWWFAVLIVIFWVSIFGWVAWSIWFKGK
jgi:uncharacterized membrane protein YkvA (DUF1232 family)